KTNCTAMLPLGIVADEISRDFRQAVQTGLQVGLRRYEIRFLQTGRAPLCEERELRDIETICNNEGVTITALSPGLFKWTDSAEKFRMEMNEVFPRAVELAQRWQLSALVVFGFCKPGATEANADTIAGDNPPPWVIDALTEAAAAAACANLQLYIEPEPVCYADRGTTAVELIRAVNSDNLGINYDPCNDAWMLRRDPIDDFAVVAPFIRNVHIKDQRAAPRGSGRPTWVVPGQGMLDWPGHLRALKQSRYHGPYSLEPHIDGSLDTIRACKRAIEDIWNEIPVDQNGILIAP
ncbi:MAG TPA: sugar phosphate isomerase/epimerase, partial [Blastocatellia bacterium]|nr:sugar phosphate isomerase/epimerase [Blastocatellia bacterium]